MKFSGLFRVWRRQRREKRELERVSAGLDAPAVPDAARRAWFDIPTMRKREVQHTAPTRPWAIAAIFLAIAVLLSAKDGIGALAQTVKDATRPERIPLPDSGPWLSKLVGASDPWSYFAFIGFTIGAIAIAAVVVLAFRRKKQTGHWPQELQVWARRNRSSTIALVVWALLVLSSALADLSPDLKIIIALLVPGMFFAWLFALMSADVVVDSTHRQVSLYLKSIPRYLLVIVLVVLLYSGSILRILKGLNPVFWLLGISLGWILSPIFLRLLTSLGCFDYRIEIEQP